MLSWLKVCNTRLQLLLRPTNRLYCYSSYCCCRCYCCYSYYWWYYLYIVLLFYCFFWYIGSSVNSLGYISTCFFYLFCLAVVSVTSWVSTGLEPGFWRCCASLVIHSLDLLPLFAETFLNILSRLWFVFCFFLSQKMFLYVLWCKGLYCLVSGKYWGTYLTLIFCHSKCLICCRGLCLFKRDGKC